MSANNVVNATGEAAVEGVNQFVKLLKDFNVIGFALGVMIGNNAAELANSFIDGIIMPTLGPALKRVSGKNMTVNVGGLTFHLEKFFNALMKFFAMALVIFILLQVGVSMTKPVTWVSVRSVADGVSL
jgi:large-conductance mechanosensitive channel